MKIIIGGLGKWLVKLMIGEKDMELKRIKKIRLWLIKK